MIHSTLAQVTDRQNSALQQLIYLDEPLIWLPWKRVERDGKKKKVALQLSGRWASSTRYEDWQGYRRAEAYVESLRADGLCFNVGQTPYTVLDLDAGGDAEAEQKRRAFVRYFDSYTERSPGGGTHVIVSGCLPCDHSRKISDFFGLGAPLEIYQTDRYMTFTGDGNGKRIEDRQAQLDKLYQRRLKVQGRLDAPLVERSAGRSDRGLLEAIQRKAEWRELYEGGGGQDASSLDWALCKLLRFLGADAEQSDRLFRQSGCFRSKWDEQRGRLTYGELTLRSVFGETAQGDAAD